MWSLKPGGRWEKVVAGTGFTVPVYAHAKQCQQAARQLDILEGKQIKGLNKNCSNELRKAYMQYDTKDKQTDRQTDRQTGRQTEGWTYIYTYIHTEGRTYIHTYTQTDTQTEQKRDRQTLPNCLKNELAELSPH